MGTAGRQGLDWRVHTETGVVYLLEAFPEEATDENLLYDLEITAFDHGNPELQNTTHIQISVTAPYYIPFEMMPGGLGFITEPFSSQVGRSNSTVYESAFQFFRGAEVGHQSLESGSVRATISDITSNTLDFHVRAR